MDDQEKTERLAFLRGRYISERRKEWEAYLIREQELYQHFAAIWHLPQEPYQGSALEEMASAMGHFLTR